MCSWNSTCSSGWASSSRRHWCTLGGPKSFGHFGAGGSAGWADPDANMAFGYVMNKMAMGLAGDTRCYDLVNACYEAAR